MTSSSGAVITVPGRNGARVDLTMQLPEKSLATVNASHGDVTVEGLKNNADVTSGHGDVKFDSISGDVHAAHEPRRFLRAPGWTDTPSWTAMWTT